MPPLLLVRHAAPLIDPSVPSREWTLSQEGEEAARRFAQGFGLPSVPVCSSPEVKAVQTARLLAEPCGARVDIEGDLREVEGRRWTNRPEEYEAIVNRYLRGQPVEGWEERSNAQGRIVAVAERLMQSEGDTLLVSHGLVLVLCLAWLLEVEPAILFPVWRAMRFPDLCIVDWKNRAVVRPFGQPL